MFCPQCGTETLEQIKFCKKCGADLRGVAKAILQGESANENAFDPFGWQMEVWKEEQKKKKRMSPEEKRYNEIKGGVITSCVGLGLLIFLTMLFSAIASTLPGPEADILRAIPFVGLIPVLIGAGVIINGVFVSKRIVELKRSKQTPPPLPGAFPAPNTSPINQLPEPSQTPISDFSVTEPTTTKLREPIQVSTPRDSN